MTERELKCIKQRAMVMPANDPIRRELMGLCMEIERLRIALADMRDMTNDLVLLRAINNTLES